MALEETKAKAQRGNKHGKLMSSKSARLLTSEEFHAAIAKDEELVEAQKVMNAKNRALAAAKHEWKANDIARRKELKVENERKWVLACAAAVRAGVKKPKKPKAPLIPEMPDDEFFEIDIGEQGHIPISDVSGNEDDED